MEFEFNEEHRMVREMVRGFALREIAPGVEERDKSGRFPAEIIEKAAELGLCGISVPEADGGAGFDAVSNAIAVMELARVCPSTAITLGVTNAVYCYPLQKFGTAEQKERFLRPAAAGEFLGAFCLTEPDAGSDTANLKTKAVEDGDYFVLEGTKAWITNGSVAGAYIVMAATGEREKGKEISAFIVPADSEGVAPGGEEEKMGLRASNTTQVVFEGCRVHRDQMLGSRGRGIHVALATLDHSRIGVAAQACGLAGAALEEAVKYSQQRTAFGKPLCAHQAISFMLADMVTWLNAAELMTYRAAWKSDSGELFTRESAMAKYYAAEAAKRITDMAVQIHGAYGYSKEYAVERFYRDARITTIYEGTSEIQKIVIARSLLRD